MRTIGGKSRCDQSQRELTGGNPRMSSLIPFRALAKIPEPSEPDCPRVRVPPTTGAKNTFAKKLLTLSVTPIIELGAMRTSW